MAFQKKKEDARNYLFIVLGLLFLAAIAVIVAYAFSIGPIEGCVGVVQVKGEIVTEDIEGGMFSDSVKGADTIAAEIEEADKRPDVAAILLLVDSPGGSVVGSKQIYDAIFSLKKPSTAYINELAASGGYYVASASDYIVANPDSITGSIGAKMTAADMSGLFSKIGYNETVIKSGAMKDIGSSSRQMTPEEYAVLQNIVNESFNEFRTDVERGRGDRLDASGWKQVLDARILSGRQAKKIGMVDELGNKKAAIKKAAALGGIKGDEPRTCEISSTSGKKGLLGSLSAEALRFLVNNAGSPRLAYR